MENKEISIAMLMQMQDECTEKTNAIIALDEQLKRKEQKLAKIEETIELAKEEGCRGCSYSKTDKCFKCYETEEKILEILKQTLQEIKDYCNKYSQNSIGFKQQILQKINGCEGDNEV